ncbi:unnamed protein product [Parascedosporium putredinis]|uniref:MARVEL domain-containing protein n=1 Tax=Parascedosporium putredinis TaxID=1442378 RepID=A0A9P1M9M6_9PEZI|nr:unnamed protein product [Parascedosporium putredinis]CAI7995100.1 unnamed protein product [Parascedosporium putredinis]
MSQQYQQVPLQPEGIPLQQQYQQPQQPVAHVPVAHAPVAAPAAAHSNVLVTPTWKLAVRGVQIFITLAVLGLSGHIIHGAYMDPFGLAIAVVVLSWVGLAYILLTEKVASLRSAYIVYAVLAVDLFLTIMWLATMGATAHMRAAFKYTANISGCYDDGSLIGSMTCFKLRKRGFVAGPVGLAEMTVVACISALNFILFAVCFVTSLLAFFRQRKTATPGGVPVADGGEKQQPVVYTQPAPAAYPTQAPAAYPQAAVPAAVPVQQAYQQQPIQPIQPQYTGGYPQQQQPIQPQYTGSTFSQPIAPQYTGGNISTPTPPRKTSTRLPEPSLPSPSSTLPALTSPRCRPLPSRPTKSFP